MNNIKDKLPENSTIMFRAITGSTSYGLNTKDSDVDYKTIYIQSNDDILSNKYIPQIDISPDDVAYELRRFLELVSVGNPNVLELLWLDDEFILYESAEWKIIKGYREVFLTKNCLNTYSGYARTQLRKATSTNKKYNLEKSKTVRKDIMDFTKIQICTLLKYKF